MIWVDGTVKIIRERKLPLEWVDDMKTPSGRIHVGALRGVLIHDLMYKALVENGLNAKFTYVFNDHDPMDAIPTYLDKSKYKKYMGMQLYKIPSPEKGFANFAECYAKEFQSVFERINCHPEIIWSSQLYVSGKMNEAIRIVLDAADKIKDIYLRISKAKKPVDWHPFQPVCEKCKKVGTTFVYKWDGRDVHYRCMPNMVDWATGCGYEGKISPFNGNGKLVWKLDWPSHWYEMGVTIEGSGKDHISAGGSYDFASAVMKEIFNRPAPYAIPYEWFIVGGRKMSSSKGVGASAFEIASILPSEVFRFLIVRTPIERALDFSPYGDTIPNLFDEYDRCMNAYFDKIENKLPIGKQGEILSDFARIAELSQVDEPPLKRHMLPRFRTIVNLIGQNKDIKSFFQEKKGSTLNEEELKILKERTVFAEVYIKTYQQQKEHTLDKRNNTYEVLSNEQKKFIAMFLQDLNSHMTSDEIKSKVFSIAKAQSIPVKEAFKGLYLSLTGLSYGPNIGALITSMGIEKARKSISQKLDKP